MWNIHMKLFKNWTCGSGKDVILKKVYGRPIYDRLRTKTDHISLPRVFESSELKAGL